MNDDPKARTTEERLAELEASTEQLRHHIVLLLEMAALSEIAQRFTAKRDAWPSRDAAIYAYAEQNRIEVLHAAVSFVRDDITRSEIADEAIGKLMVRAAERVEAALRARGEELGAALIEHADAIDALAAPPPAPPAPKEE